MCLVFLSYNQHPQYSFISVSNRDEFFDRKAEKMHFWPEYPNVLAGKDISAGGTWMGLTTTGRFSMLTNYRDMANIKSNAPTRGKLVLDYLVGEFDPSLYLEALNADAERYNGYNILLGTLDDPWYFSNQNKTIYRLGTGLYGLSNALLDTKWPKVQRGKERFGQLIEQQQVDPDALINMMYDTALADDTLLPDTGIGFEKEKLLSSMFINMPGYGTRNTTVVLKDRQGNVVVKERTYDEQRSTSDVEFGFKIQP